MKTLHELVADKLEQWRQILPRAQTSTEGFAELLALVKLMLGRQKDLDLLRALVKLGLLEAARLRTHYQQTPRGDREAATAGRNLTLLLR